MIRRIVFGIAAFPLCALSLSAQTAAPHATLPAGLPLRVAIDHRYPIRIGTRVQGHLTTAVYLVDHIVLPVDTPVYGVIVGRHPVKKSVRINALLDGDFTRLSVPEIRFETMQLPDGSETAFTAAAIERDSVIVRMNRNKPDNSVSGILKAEYTARRREIMGGYVSPGKSERLRQWFYHMLPYHPQNLWTGQQFDAELSEPLEVAQADDTPAALPIEDLKSNKPTGTIEARLTENLTSATCPVGMSIHAVLSKPLLDKDREHVLLPEGTMLQGSIVESQPAAMFGRNGRLRFAFHKIELADDSSEKVHGIVTAAESAPNANITIDSEGGARATSPNPALGTLTLAVLAAASRGDDGGSPLNSAIVSNGFGMMGRLASMATGNKDVASGFAYYAFAKNVVRRYIAKGKDVSFPRNTRIQIDLAER